MPDTRKDLRLFSFEPEWLKAGIEHSKCRRSGTPAKLISPSVFSVEALRNPLIHGLKVIINRGKSFSLSIQIDHSGTVCSEVYGFEVILIGTGQLLHRIFYPLLNQVNIITFESVVILDFGKSLLILSNNFQICIEQKKLFIGFSYIKNGYDRFFHYNNGLFRDSVRAAGSCSPTLHLSLQKYIFFIIEDLFNIILTHRHFVGQAIVIPDSTEWFCLKKLK